MDLFLNHFMSFLLSKYFLLLFSVKKECDENSEFQCGDRTCILKKFVCDGKNDCNDQPGNDTHLVYSNSANKSYDEDPVLCSTLILFYIFLSCHFCIYNIIF